MFSIFSLISTLNIFYFVFLSFCTQLIKNFWGIKYSWINNLAKYTNENTDLAFITNYLVIYLALYMIFAAVKGNDYYGYRSSCFTFYAMT